MPLVLTLPLGLILLTLLGVGITWSLLPAYVRPARLVLLGLAPVMGYIALGFVLTAGYVLLDVPLRVLVLPTFVGLLLLNAGLWVWHVRQNPLHERVNRRELLLGFGVFGVALGGLVLPSAIGGEAYQYWQGNGWDAINYLLMGWHAQNAPLSALFNPQGYPDIYYIQQGMAHPEFIGSPTVGYVMAALAQLFDVPIHRYYFYYKLLLVALTLPITLSLAKHMRLWGVVPLGLALTLGFWTMFAFDHDALRQIASQPLLLGLVLAWWIDEHQPTRRLWGRAIWLLVMLFTGLLLYYPEILPPALLGVGLYELSLVVRQPRAFLPRVARYGLVLGLSLFLLILINRYLLPYLFSQSNAAVSEINQWHFGTFAWLFDPNAALPGILGLHFFRIITPDRFALMRVASWGAVYVFGVGVAALLMWGLVRLVLRPDARTKALAVMFTLFVGFFGAGLALILTERQWTGSKVINMGYVFLPLTLSAVITLLMQSASRTWWARGAQVLLWVWCLVQIGTPLAKTTYILREKPIEQYFSIAPQTFLDAQPIVGALADSDGLTLWDTNQYSTAIDNWYITGAWALMAEESGVPYVAYRRPTLRDVGDMSASWQPFDAPPSQWVLSSNRDFLAGVQGASFIAGNPNSIALYRVQPDVIDRLLPLMSPIAEESRYVLPHTGIVPIYTTTLPADFLGWHIADRAQVRVVSAGTTAFELRVALAPVATDTPLTATLTVNGEPAQTGTGEFSVCWQPRTGENRLALAVDAPSYLTTFELVSGCSSPQRD